MMRKLNCGIATLILMASANVAMATPTRCNPDGALPITAKTAVTVVSSNDSEHGGANAAEADAKQPADTGAGGNNPVANDAGSSGGGGGADGALPGTHRHGLRWQSFLPGMIR